MADTDHPPRHPRAHHLRDEVEHELHEVREHAHELRERLHDAAVEAELETGRREPTRAEAEAGVLKRTVRMSIGFTVLVLGLVLMALPGPGLLTVAVGLGILSRDVPWAERLLERVRRRLPQGEEGGVSKPVIATTVVAAVVAVAASAWFMLR